MMRDIVKARDERGNVSIMGEHDDRLDALEHEQMLTKEYPLMYVWIETVHYWNDDEQHAGLYMLSLGSSKHYHDARY